MATDTFRFRQVHLDFHTSPDIPGIGADFDPEEFVATLKEARVDSITCFARCHHGHVYYQSKKNPERIHPHLERPNLLPDQIRACHSANIKVPIYITVQWDHYSALEHPEWLCVDVDGKQYGGSPLRPGFYQILDVFHPGYRRFLFDHVQEVLESMPVDGLFFDIVDARPSLAPHWIQAMREEGLDIESAATRQAFAQQVIDDWKKDMTAFVRQFNPDCTIFYNAGHVGPRTRSSAEEYTHWELESLPSGGWGYLHFPQAMRFARTLGKPCLGMTGKFHTSWGDFGSYKNPAALEFETMHMIALGAKCSIGDQLPPRGRLDRQTYELIGGAYKQIEAKQPWCVGANPVVEAAILTNEGSSAMVAESLVEERNLNNVLGAIRLMQELQVQFDIVDGQSDWFPYRLLILPDSVYLDDALAAKLNDFVSAGGSVVASHQSGRLGREGDFHHLFGFNYEGPAPFSPDFLIPREAWGSSLPATGHVMYLQGNKINPLSTQVLADAQVPYFNRTWNHFCSHAHTPSSGEVGYPAVVQNGNVVYFAHPIFRQYFDSAPLWIKSALRDALRGIFHDPVVSVAGPSSLIVSLTEQPEERRHVVHLLHYIPERRGAKFDVIEDVIPVFDLWCRVGVPGVKGVRIVPSGESIPFDADGGGVTFMLPRLDGHAMVELSRYFEEENPLSYLLGEGDERG